MYFNYMISCTTCYTCRLLKGEKNTHLVGFTTDTAVKPRISLGSRAKWDCGIAACAGRGRGALVNWVLRVGLG